MLEAAIFVIFAFAMAFAAVSDLLTMTIANRVSLVLIASFALIAPLTGMDMATYGMHFAAGALVLLVTFTLFAFGGMGGGDAKLLTAVAVWCGFSDVLFEYLLIAALLGGWLTVGIVIFRGTMIADMVSARFAFAARLNRSDVGIPYGIALGAAGLAVAPSMPLIKWALAHAAM